jgi:magnesium transporter
MMQEQDRLLDAVREHLEDVIAKAPPLGLSLWQSLVQEHPADIAAFLGSLDREAVHSLFLTFDESLQLEVFQELSDSLKVFCLAFLDDQSRTQILNGTPLDQLTDLFETLPDEELKNYLKLLHKNDRDTVLSLLEFDPESAGGIMETDVLSLMDDYTVEKSIRVLQRLQPDQNLHRRICVTNQDNMLVGYINLEDLVLKQPTARISSFLRINELVVNVHEDQETIARNMVHYGLVTVPVVDDRNIFLGLIAAETLVDIIEDEASEDVYKMATMAPIKQPYFETSFFKLFQVRSTVLIILLIAQIFSTLIVQHYESLLEGFLMLFLPMLISTGGNASSQTSAFVIQGMTSGEINHTNMGKFVRRELYIGCSIALVLGIFSFGRIVIMHGTENLMGAIAVSCSLSLIVMVSVLLGACMPFMLKRLRLDPAFSAGPGLATLMDILGLLIYCYISKLMLP